MNKCIKCKNDNKNYIALVCNHHMCFLCISDYAKKKNICPECLTDCSELFISMNIAHWMDDSGRKHIAKWAILKNMKSVSASSLNSY